MEGLLTAVSTVNHGGLEPSNNKTPIEPLAKPQDGNDAFHQGNNITSPEYVLEILKSSPSKEQVTKVLTYLDPTKPSGKEFNIKSPTPLAAQILHLLITTVIADHWSSLESKTGASGDKPKLLRCLSSVSGIGALVAHMRGLLATLASSGQKSSGSQIVAGYLLSALSSLLKPQAFLLHIYVDITRLVHNHVQRQIIWKELISLLAAGKVLSAAAEAVHAIKAVDARSSAMWLSEGNHYASWVGRSVYHMASRLQPEDVEGWKCLTQFSGRSLSLGYTDQFVAEVYSGLVMHEPVLTQHLTILLDQLRPHEQRTILESILRDLEKRYFLESPDEIGSLARNYREQKVIGGVSALILAITKDRHALRASLMEWLATGIGGSVRGISLRRALVAALGQDQDALTELLGKGIGLFGDKLYIKHTPSRGQEANAQVILLTAGHLHRVAPTELRNIVKSGLYLSSISNHLAASSPRSRFLGMAVGMAISALVDSPDKTMKFEVEEMQSDEAVSYMGLTSMQDKIGSIRDLMNLEKHGDDGQKKKDRSTPKANARARPKPVVNISKVTAIEELSDSESDDLMSYEKPDTDASDSEEDATLIQRSKPSAPVYVRDLVSSLRDTDNAERYQLGISTAATLIRRKASFGTEVAENAEQLGLLLVGLQDKYNMPKFQEHRLQSQVALILALPLTMGQWFSHTLFTADLSQVQRSSILVALGLSVRELAGFGKEDSEAMDLPTLSDTSFPSKRLPSSLEPVYEPIDAPIGAISKRIFQSTLRPLALDAADSFTGPNALKVRTFSSRMEVEKKKQQREQERKRSTSKDIYKTLSDGFFFPLTNGFALLSYTISSNNAYNPFLTPQLLCLFVQTITLTLSTLGPNTPNLVTLTQDSLALLISLHNAPVATEPTILTAILSLFLAVVDLNISFGSAGEERLVTEFATHVMEMREWVNGVFERAPREDEDVRILAAGIMVKLGEVTERYQGRLLGTDMNFGY
ncbi:hypothetical protein AJ80_08939 [Polytolypa hystricis UAMH7299]|uniref:Telomere length regulation protein conserved domain-containing protein n=1 Tax=Polytolypa hystricis (strain UAMH7299) TaxID=1447883 RepID=A0A2B7WZG7_POLH7|nr:hypothetical protein AJ80_08939 [Polytolypa hystricis UAMH7299]